jgi:hypothetical protein
MIYFSPSAVAFYDSELHAAFPADVLPIDADLHRSLLAAQEAGLCIVTGPDGGPIVVEAPVPPSDEMLALIRMERDKRLRASDFSQMADVPLTDDQRAAWCVYRQALRDLPETTIDLAAVVWPVAPAERNLNV